MSAKLIVPFDNNPASTSIKTTSYTIPAGKYARVKGFFIASGTATNATTYTHKSISINGSPVFYEPSFSYDRSTQITANSSFTVPSTFNGDFFSAINWSNSSATYVTSVSTSLDSGVLYTASLGSGTASQSQHNGVVGGSAVFLFYPGSYGRMTGTIYFSNSSVKYFETWVPSGTVLSGDAGVFNWIVTEYNVIS